MGKKVGSGRVWPVDAPLLSGRKRLFADWTESRPDPTLDQAITLTSPPPARLARGAAPPLLARSRVPRAHERSAAPRNQAAIAEAIAARTRPDKPFACHLCDYTAAEKLPHLPLADAHKRSPLRAHCSYRAARGNALTRHLRLKEKPPPAPTAIIGPRSSTISLSISRYTSIKARKGREKHASLQAPKNSTDRGGSALTGSTRLPTLYSRSKSGRGKRCSGSSDKMSLLHAAS